MSTTAKGKGKKFVKEVEKTKLEEALQNLFGVGPTLTKFLIHRLTALGLMDAPRIKKDDYTEEELRKILKNKKIFGELPVATKVDLIYNPLKEIPRDIIHIMDGELHKYLKGIKFDIAGSYRRGKPISHDIDLVVSKGRKGVDVLDLMINLVNRGSSVLHIYPPFARGPDKATILFEITVPQDLQPLLDKYPKRWIVSTSKGKETIKKVRMKIDVFLTEPDEYIFALLFATGSGAFNVRMRATAKRQGYLLNQHGLFKKIGDKVLEKLDIETEKEVFEKLGMTYRTPEQRIK
jgi:DNA polymerase/3'-5' exonuclease PolX